MQAIRYANEPSWIQFSGGTRLAAAGARNADQDPMGEGARTVAGAIQDGRQFPELIAVQSADGSLILVEGHTRATAHILAESTKVEVIIGSSPGMITSGVICLCPTCHLSSIEAYASLAVDRGFPHNVAICPAAAKFAVRKSDVSKEITSALNFFGSAQESGGLADGRGYPLHSAV